MSAAKNKKGSSKDTGKGAGSAEIDTSASASAGLKGGSKASKGAKDETPAVHTPIVNTGADALPNATRPAPQAQVEELKKGESKEIYLDKVYTFHGRHYGPSAHPGNLIRVPKDFPEHILPTEGKAPSLDDWAKNRPPESAVIEIPDESARPL